MREQLIKFLEKQFGDPERFYEGDLKVDAYAFVNDSMELKGVKIVGNDECFDGDEFYHYILAGDKLYKAYFELAEDEDGNELELDMVDYSHAYCIVDVTDAVIDAVM